MFTSLPSLAGNPGLFQIKSNPKNLGIEKLMMDVSTSISPQASGTLSTVPESLLFCLSVTDIPRNIPLLFLSGV